MYHKSCEAEILIFLALGCSPWVEESKRLLRAMAMHKEQQMVLKLMECCPLVTTATLDFPR